jgi:hypothetical protein
MSSGSRWTSNAHVGGHPVRRARAHGRGVGVLGRAEFVETLGRAGFAARGVVYLLIAWIALMIVFEHRALEADRTGALELVAGKPFGFVVLWFLIVGFAGMALWRAATAVHAGAANRRNTGSRLASAGKAVLYAVAAYTTARFTVTGHANGSTNRVSTDFTADAMRHPGGRLLVGAVGIGLLIGGCVLVQRGLDRSFARNLRVGSMSARTRRRVVFLGTVGNVARGAILAGAGVFLIDAAVTFRASRARGVDGTLRAFASAPAGPVILVLLAIGLAAFGCYSFCEARWRRL